ncbi:MULTISPECIES: PilZ domain-containing protein [unclassified Aureimonas]|uniref:PilZ domain-containing protein n=1 Tax=unclassified Aureimonas TaxID=2615206 RepID=UPI0006FB353B|nr:MULTISPECIES: PilZ domain-containing protein [unclassified Aureimonas]KQT57520.1 pilus assembly protein PilZ [Aureimonas sp. Leaf427]KQT77200.1 pilus assembly protein PilZ [Aureimonas sp. Leaf460]
MNNLATAPEGDQAERRRFHRVAVDLLGRFMLEDQSEYPCRVQNMSAGDIAVLTAAMPRKDERVILYADHIGRLEGLVTRVFSGGFAMNLRVTERKREKLAAQITWLANRHELDLPEDRRHERIHPKNPFIDIALEDGRTYKVRIIDLSLSGAAVKSDVRPALGSRIRLGTMQGRVVRHLEEGLAIEFAAVQLRETLEKL